MMKTHKLCRLAPPILSGILGVALTFSVNRAVAAAEIDSAILDQWSAPYRGWHYYPTPVIPAEPNVPGNEQFKNTDVPCVYQLPGQPSRYYMSYIAFDGKGYNSFVAESEDLVTWKNHRLAMGFGKEGEFDHGGCVIGAFLYEFYGIKSPRILKKREGKFWTLYGAYPRQGGYELRPGYEGVASSDDGQSWHRAKNQPVLAVQDTDLILGKGLHLPTLARGARESILQFLQCRERRYRANGPSVVDKSAQLAQARSESGAQEPQRRI